MDEILIKNSERRTVKNINAHKSGVVALEKDQERNIFALVIKKGKIFRIFSTANEPLIKNKKKNRIFRNYSINFDKNYKFLHALQINAILILLKLGII